MSTVAERLAGFTSTLTADALPPEVALAAKLHVLDTLGCGLAAFAVGVASGARDAMLEPGTTGPRDRHRRAARPAQARTPPSTTR